MVDYGKREIAGDMEAWLWKHVYIIERLVL
jgi:hypothetical protein